MWIVCCCLTDEAIVEWERSWKQGGMRDGVGKRVGNGWGVKRGWEGCGDSCRVGCSMVLHWVVVQGTVLKGLVGYVGKMCGELTCHSLIGCMARGVCMDGMLVVSVCVARGRVCV